jgi:hypothetical protein
MLWSREEANPNILLARPGECPDRLIAEFRDQQRGNGIDADTCVVLTIHSNAPEPILP